VCTRPPSTDNPWRFTASTLRAPTVPAVHSAGVDPFEHVAERVDDRPPAALASSPVAESAEEKHDQEDDEDPSPDRHRLFLRSFASRFAYARAAPPDANVFLAD
jgi:hypothetical protein